MLVSFLQAVVACNATVLRVSILVLFILSVAAGFIIIITYWELYNVHMNEEGRRGRGRIKVRRN